MVSICVTLACSSYALAVVFYTVYKSIRARNVATGSTHTVDVVVVDLRNGVVLSCLFE